MHQSFSQVCCIDSLSLYIYTYADRCLWIYSYIYIYMVCISCSLWKWRILKNNASLYTMQVHPVVSLSPAAPWRRSSACRAFGATSGRCDPNSKPRAKDVNLAKLNSFGFWDWNSNVNFVILHEDSTVEGGQCHVDGVMSYNWCTHAFTEMATAQIMFCWLSVRILVYCTNAQTYTPHRLHIYIYMCVCVWKYTAMSEVNGMSSIQQFSASTPSAFLIWVTCGGWPSGRSWWLWVAHLILQLVWTTCSSNSRWWSAPESGSHSFPVSSIYIYCLESICTRWMALTCIYIYIYLQSPCSIDMRSWLCASWWSCGLQHCTMTRRYVLGMSDVFLVSIDLSLYIYIYISMYIYIMTQDPWYLC